MMRISNVHKKKSKIISRNVTYEKQGSKVQVMYNRRVRDRDSRRDGVTRICRKYLFTFCWEIVIVNADDKQLGNIGTRGHDAHPHFSSPDPKGQCELLP